MDTAETDENVPTLESMAAEMERLTVAGSLSWWPMGTDGAGRYVAFLPDGAPSVELKCHGYGAGLRVGGWVVEPSSALVDAVVASSEAWVKRQAERKRRAVRDALTEVELPVEAPIVCGGSMSDEIRAQECVSCDFRWFGGGDAPEHYEDGPEVEPVPVPSGWTCSACSRAPRPSDAPGPEAFAAPPIRHTPAPSAMSWWDRNWPGLLAALAATVLAVLAVVVLPG